MKLVKNRMLALKITIILLFFMCVGCSTLISNAMSSSNTYYSGTKLDISIIAAPVDCSNSGDVCEFTKGFPFIWPLALIDLPLCIAADTLYFPFQYRN